MQQLLFYCLKFSISLGVVSLFYHLALRRLTFYKLNRYFLMGASCLCFLISFVDISPLVERSSWTTSYVATWIPVVHHVEIVEDGQNVSSLVTAGDIVATILILGIGIMFVRLLFQLLSLHRLRSRARMIGGDGPRVYEVNDSIIPFSFGQSIYVNKGLHTESELVEIIRHEFVHVRQLHSVDIMWSEIICILNWYNPLAWLLRFSIRQNLEFIADSEVLQNGVNKKEYQYLLLKVVGNNQFSVVQNFNFSSLKKRIAMMNKSKSARLNLVRFLFSLPLIAILLFAFRNNESPNRSRQNWLAPRLVRQLSDTVPTPSKSVKSNVAATNKKLSAASDDYEINEDRAVVHLKDGTTEEYDLKNKEQRKKFEDKYGQIVSVNIHKGPTTTVSVVTAEGVTTAVVPVTVVGASTNVTSVTAIADHVPEASAASENTSAVSAVSPGRPSTASGVTVINSDDGNLITVTPEVLFTITKSTTRQQLEELIKQMKEKGFDLNFKDVKYTDGKLVSISGTIQSMDASGVFVAVSFSKLVVSVIKDGSRIYFRVDEQHAVKRVI